MPEKKKKYRDACEKFSYLNTKKDICYHKVNRYRGTYCCRHTTAFFYFYRAFMFNLKYMSSAALLSVAMLAGCASIMNEETQSINLTTTGNKQITGNVDGKAFTGPGVVSVKRAKVARLVTVDTAGCTSQTTLPNEVDSKFWVNILSGGPLGSSTDYSTGKMWKYQENVAISCQ